MTRFAYRGGANLCMRKRIHNNIKRRKKTPPVDARKLRWSIACYIAVCSEGRLGERYELESIMNVKVPKIFCPTTNNSTLHLSWKKLPSPKRISLIYLSYYRSRELPVRMLARATENNKIMWHERIIGLRKFFSLLFATLCKNLWPRNSKGVHPCFERKSIEGYNNTVIWQKKRSVVFSS